MRFLPGTCIIIVMNARPITVADLIAFLQTVPPDTKIAVLREVTANYSTYTEYTQPVQFGSDEAFNIDVVDGISYHNNFIYFGIN